MKHAATGLGLLVWLAACGGGGGGGGGIDPRLARLGLYEAQKLRVLGDDGAGVMGMAATADENMPAGGVMTFAGHGAIRIETGGQPLALLGDAQMQVDFGNSNASGVIENTFGATTDGKIVDYTGAITMQGTATIQNMPLSYSGTLSAGDQTLVFSGAMNGVFRGNPTVALSAADLEAAVVQNGMPRTATVVVTFEQVPAP